VDIPQIILILLLAVVLVAIARGLAGVGPTGHVPLPAEIEAHPAYAGGIGANARDLDKLAMSLTARTERPAALSLLEAEQDREDLRLAHQEYSKLAAAIRQDRPKRQDLHTRYGRADGEEAWRLWRIVDRRLEDVRELLAAGQRRVTRGYINSAEPLHTTSALWRRLGPIGGELDIDVRERIAVVRCRAPRDEVPRTLLRERGPADKRVVVAVTRPDRDVNFEYLETLTSTARVLIKTVFDVSVGLERVQLTMTQRRRHPLRGHEYDAVVLALDVDRATWFSIHHEHVTSENALRNFALRLRYDNEYRLQEVSPLGQDLGHVVADPLDLDSIAFEELIGDLLQRMGLRATVTKASGDGGIDVEAESTDDILGGRILVQCKRYEGSVGSPVVRDLYGALTDARAMKGILVTTSWFSAEAKRFADGKPIELIDGTRLRQLLNRYRLIASESDAAYGEASEAERAAVTTQTEDEFVAYLSVVLLTGSRDEAVKTLQNATEIDASSAKQLVDLLALGGTVIPPPISATARERVVRARKPMPLIRACRSKSTNCSAGARRSRRSRRTERRWVGR